MAAAPSTASSCWSPSAGALTCVVAGLASVGLDESAYAVPVDDRMRVADGLWAIGDVTGVGAFTHLSRAPGPDRGRRHLGVPGFAAYYTALPRVTFTDPEVGSVGQSEAAARAAGLDVRTGSAPVSASSRGRGGPATMRTTSGPG